MHPRHHHRRHRHPYWHRYPMNAPGGFVRSKMHRRIFAWFGAAIVVTGFLVAALSRFLGWENSWKQEGDRVRAFASHEFAAVWSDPVRRHALAERISHDMRVSVRLVDADDHELERVGPTCKRPMSVDVAGDGPQLGRVDLCADRHMSFFWPMGIALVVLWAFSGAIARRVTRPLAEVARVAEELGKGNLQARVRLSRRHDGELRYLAVALGDMAERIERQLNDQRALLATVSHEIRTPLARMRLLVEGARGSDPATSLDGLEREVEEVDALVGDLLVSARLDFATMKRNKLRASELATRAFEVSGAPIEALSVETDASVEVDATLFVRALVNLIENARRHAGGIREFRVTEKDGRIAWDALDEGPGFGDSDPGAAFEPFRRSEKTGSVGLGLSLVRRIAEAHGGRAYAENLPDKGARVGIEIPISSV